MNECIQSNDITGKFMNECIQLNDITGKFMNECVNSYATKNYSAIVKHIYSIFFNDMQEKEIITSNWYQWKFLTLG